MQFFSQIRKQWKAEAEAFGIRRLKVQSIDRLLESTKFGKVKGCNIIKCTQKKYFSYIIGKFASLRRNFSKALVILAWFLLLFLLLFFKVSFFTFLSYKYMKIWYFYGQYKANGLGTIEKSYNIFDLSHMSIVAAHFQKKNKTFIYSFRCPNKESGKIFKK